METLITISAVNTPQQRTPYGVAIGTFQFIRQSTKHTDAKPHRITSEQLPNGEGLSAERGANGAQEALPLALGCVALSVEVRQVAQESRHTGKIKNSADAG
jgi:hypothetical protein